MSIKFPHALTLILAVLSVVAPLNTGAAATLKDLETFRAQFRQFTLDRPEKDDSQTLTPEQANTKAHTWLNAQHADGSWSDIDYTSPFRGSWKALDHLARVQSLAKTFLKIREQGKDDPAMLKGILAGLNYWTTNNFQNRNWWFQSIGTPRALCDILILMEGYVSPEAKEAAFKCMTGMGLRGGGTNLAWTAGAKFKKAALSGDPAGAQKMHDLIASVLDTTTGDGIQRDESYHFHGSQLMTGGYGIAVFTDLIDWGSVWRGTSFALSDKHMEHLRNFSLQGEAVIVANGTMDVSSGGGFSSFKQASSKGKLVLDHLNMLATLDPVHADAYQAAIAQDSAPSGAGNSLNRMYYRSDFMVQRRPDYFATLKMCSNRVIGSESLNYVNLRVRFVADGTLFLYQASNEYTDIFPVWDWRRIPGVTCATSGPTGASGKMVTDYAGGVSDGTYGACGLALNRDGVTGKKAWFFFDHQVVCLGADLTAAKGEAIATSIEQCLLNGSASAATGTSAGQALPTGEQRLEGAKWVWHNNRGYYFPTSQQVVERNAAQTGNWNNVRRGDEPEPVPISKQIFSLWLEHGAHAANAAYSYVVLPAATTDQVTVYAAHPQMTILANTGSVQAVRDTSTDLVAALFYAPGTVETSAGPLEVDGSCAVLLHKGAQGYSLTVSDPVQHGTKLKVTLGGKAMGVDLPQGDAAGSSVNVPVR